jgi:hypothetical protein
MCLDSLLEPVVCDAVYENSGSVELQMDVWDKCLATFDISLETSLGPNAIERLAFHQPFDRGPLLEIESV